MKARPRKSTSDNRRLLMDSQQRTSSAFASRCDSAGCLFVDRRLVVAAEAERFRRIKRWAGLPTQAIDSCLREAGLTINELDHIAVNRISSLANATRAINASSRRSLVGFELAAPCYRPGFLSGVDKAAARTGALWDDILTWQEWGIAPETKSRPMFFSICVSEPDYAYILRRCW